MLLLYAGQLLNDSHHDIHVLPRISVFEWHVRYFLYQQQFRDKTTFVKVRDILTFASLVGPLEGVNHSGPRLSTCHLFPYLSAQYRRIPHLPVSRFRTLAVLTAEKPCRPGI